MQTENGWPWDERTCSYAARNGHLHIVKYAHENGCPWDKKTCSYALKNSHFHILDNAFDNGYEWKNGNVCSQAAKNGDLQLFMFAHKNDCPWDEKTCSNAALKGHLHLLQYAHQNSCP